MKKIKVEAPPVQEPIIIPKVHTISQEFGNGDLNILKDKINEIIQRI